MKKPVIWMVMILLVTALSAAASAAAALPPVNDQPRHTVCTALSDEAQAYYTGDDRYERLSTLSGARDVATGYTAMQDNALFDALHSLMARTHTYYTTYSGYKSGSLAYYWARTDAVSASDTYVMFYADVMSDLPGVKLNREHIWPKSRASYGTKNGGADLHHLRPAVDSLNNAKSNHLFGNIRGVYSDGVKEGSVNDTVCYWVRSSSDLFECKDDVKGDVARILLYVYCRWEQPNLYTDIPAELLPANESDSASNSGEKVVESLDTLLDWCAEDPVDTWEMRRNDLVERVQGNRNVFIDYPELAWQVFGRQIPPAMTTPTSESRAKLLGDADGDTMVSIVDATVILRYQAQLEVMSCDTRAADVDGDGSVTVLDATAIQRWLSEIHQPYAIGDPI